MAKPEPDAEPPGWWTRATPVGRAAFSVVAMGVITVVALLLSPLLWPRWEAYLGTLMLGDLERTLALQRAVHVAISVWLAALFAAGATLLLDWYWDQPRP